ncbi:AraC family transcriptional regulator [Antarcticibacterium sp. 1MA-6-2]|uniref:helix-turn-helix domain-containing protein n=1 Tax=Antarcticibacterium sp. 1MA-6-2 TaxID=2908210 RepID=UPI001F19B58A|nr:AraC family transcriptional regulator [Antarcticibacterium sp. 1MA-6-2]UJH91884.1 AraC family transcriptional regulator [Antarcticibacterium sp. 1MA-6-2]
MEEKVLYIKNVVCQRCKSSVREILEGLKIPYQEVSLGQAVLVKPLTAAEMSAIQKEFLRVGFEILFDKNERLVNKIKSIIIARIYKEENYGSGKLSKVLSEYLYYDYSHLTRLFTTIEGKTIQEFQNQVKIERIKELLEYNELNISEIARETGYSSATYLSTQFRKVT